MRAKARDIIERMTKLSGGVIELDLFLGVITREYYAHLKCVKHDFITSPEISQLFGEVIALRFIEYMMLSKDQKQGGIKTDSTKKGDGNCELTEGSPIVLLELGPGNGTLMFDMLRTISYFPQYYQMLKGVVMIEISDSLTNIQQAKLGQYSKSGCSMSSCTSANTSANPFDITWYRSLDEARHNLPRSCRVCIIGNEFFDALPIKQLIWDKQKLYEVVINDKIEMVKTPISHSIFLPWLVPDRVDISNKMVYEEISMDLDGRYQDEQYPDGLYEFSPAALQLCDEISHILKTHGGLSLIVDYGYDQPINTSSLQAIYEQKKLANIMSHLGEADISSLVNFPSLQHRFHRHGIPTKLIKQGDFLISYGIEQRAEQLKRKLRVETRDNKILVAAVARIDWQLHKLLNEMGESFKVLESIVD